MKRKIDQYLLDWASTKQRKVLVVRGARQVGKTYSIRQLGSTFPYFLEVNFEKDKDVVKFFEGNLNPQTICEKLSAYYRMPIQSGKTLLFFDEIQVCQNAISALRYFYEDFPSIHVVAAGSLLEFAFEEIPSFGVGRLTSLFMYPLCFEEFIDAIGEAKLNRFIDESSADFPMDEVFHKRILEYLKTFLIIGGMPDVVKHYVEYRDLLLCQRLLDDILLTYKQDFSKYRKNAPVVRIQDVFESISFQSGNRFRYATIDATIKSTLFKDSLEMLVKSGLAYKIFNTSASGMPLGAQIKVDQFKVILFDVGAQQREQKNNIGEMLVSDDYPMVNKGSIAEVFVGLELIKVGNPHLPPALYYWQREARSSQAEVDYVLQIGDQIVPVEVKSGTKGQRLAPFGKTPLKAEKLPNCFGTG